MKDSTSYEENYSCLHKYVRNTTLINVQLVSKQLTFNLLQYKIHEVEKLQNCLLSHVRPISCPRGGHADRKDITVSSSDRGGEVERMRWYGDTDGEDVEDLFRQ